MISKAKIDKLICCLCGNPIEPVGTWTQGCNAQPLADGRCCQTCDNTRVIPERIRRYYEEARAAKPKVFDDGMGGTYRPGAVIEVPKWKK